MFYCDARVGRSQRASAKIVELVCDPDTSDTRAFCDSDRNDQLANLE